MNCMSKTVNSLDEMDKSIETKLLNLTKKLAENLNRPITSTMN